MTNREIYNNTAAALKNSGCDFSNYDILCLMEHFLGTTRFDLAPGIPCTADSSALSDFERAVRKRCEGFPLQYLIGKWSFMDCGLFVGEGVLIPRDDTEVCVRECISLLGKNPSPKIIDLCSGSGAIAIALASHYPEADIIAAELSDKAFPYLLKNIAHNNARSITAVKGDIGLLHSDYPDGSFDAVISNPPYIRSTEIPLLQKEVQYEPVMALDGGSDGLELYRIIARHWLRKLRSGGVLSLEIGEDQGESVPALLREEGASDIRVIKDISGLDRCVTALR